MEYSNLTDEERIKLLKTEQEDMIRCQIIRSFSNDELMMQYVFTIKYEQIRSSVTYSLLKIENKIKVIESLTDENAITAAVMELPNIEHKIKMLSKIKSAHYKNMIIRSIKESDEEIVKALDSVEDEKYRALLITRIKDDNLKLKYLQEINDDINKSKIVMTIDNDDLKVEYIEKLEDRAAKSFLIASLKSKELRERYLQIYDKRYEKINVPDGMTIGMEIECEGENSIDAYLISDILEGWDSKVDSSLQEGVEITSPILSNSKSDADNLFLVCNMLQELGEQITPRCGAHIHIGADYLKTKEAYANLIELWSNNEELMFLLSNKPGEILREGVIEYASPISMRILKDIEENRFDDYDTLDKKQFIKKVKNVQRVEKGMGTVRTGINFLTTDDEERHINTIEFRVSNGTIDANTWIENANLFGGLVAISQRISDIQNKSIYERDEKDKSILEKFTKLKSKELSDEERLDMLLSLCVPEELKHIYIYRYTENSKLLEQNKKIKEGLESLISDKPINFTTESIPKIASDKRMTEVKGAELELVKALQEHQNLIQTNENNLRL